MDPGTTDMMLSLQPAFPAPSLSIAGFALQTQHTYHPPGLCSCCSPHSLFPPSVVPLPHLSLYFSPGKIQFILQGPTHMLVIPSQPSLAATTLRQTQVFSPLGYYNSLFQNGSSSFPWLWRNKQGLVPLGGTQGRSVG